MSLKEIAAGLERSFQEAIGEQDALADRVAGMVCAWDGKLEPIKTVMARYGAKYSNPRIPGETSKGVVVGECDGFLLVLSGKMVKAVNPATDEYAIEEKIYDIKDFVKSCDLRVLKAGFESVADISVIPAMKKNNELSGFLKDSKDFILNQRD